MTNSKANKGISRIDSGSTHGYFVRAYHSGKTYSKLFSDRKCGGKEPALAQAIVYRDELTATLAVIKKEPRKRRTVTSDSRNKTGELGVTRTTKTGANGTKHECYSVSWRPEPKVQKCTSFSIKKYGEKKAFKLAVEHRRKMMREIQEKAAATESQRTNSDYVQGEFAIE
ncbi:MAG: hypothetical protein ACSHYA_19220 [Opitutaceae bacterium]